MKSQQKIFFDFLRFCIEEITEIPISLKDVEWQIQYDIAKKQSLIGVMFHGIQKLPEKFAPHEDLLMLWMSMAQRIKQKNMHLFMDSAKVCKNFKQIGFRNCVLKGQGNALLYPDIYMRTPGDIDIYLEGGRKRIMKYINGIFPNQVIRYHHVDFPVMNTPIEVHFTPSYMFCPWHNRRMQTWFGKMMEQQCSNVVILPDGLGKITMPTNSFNVIYILSHLYRHVFTEGIGLRQLLDYYFVIMKSEVQTAERKVNPSVFADEKTYLEIGVLQRDLKNLGLWKFAGAVMYVLHEVFRLSEDKMIAPINEEEGKFLLDEIMIGGNFGQYDDRLGNKVNEGKIHRYIRMSLRNMRFVKHYPSEALCEPWFRTWFWAWKKVTAQR